MIIVLDEKNKADLAFLQQLPPNIVEEFCRISLELIRKGNVNRAIFKNAAGSSSSSLVSLSLAKFFSFLHR